MMKLRNIQGDSAICYDRRFIMSENTQYTFQRYEKKYILTEEEKNLLLCRMRPYIEADRYAKYTICSLYYDTWDFRLIRASIEKPVYKEKLRVRSYGTPADKDKVFIELKKKYNGVVYKRRIETTASDASDFLNGGGDGFSGAVGRFGQIGKEILWFRDFYKVSPQVLIAYDREAFSGVRNPGLRITFDSGLRWRDTALDLRLGDHGEAIPIRASSRRSRTLKNPVLQHPVLMEIKFPGTSPLWLSRMLSELKIFPSSFSKYGTCYRSCLLPDRTSKEGFLYV